MNTSKKWFLCQVMILLTGFAHYSSAIKYRFILENDDIYEACPGQPKNVLDANGFVDTSEIQLKMVSDTVAVTGNATFIWDIRPSDRVEVNIAIYRFDRGNWVKTLFGINVWDICPKLYDEQQYWYKFWTKHVSNVKDVKNKCFYPGTKLVHEPFTTDIKYDFSGPPMSGLHKILITMKAFSALQQERDTSICVQILGEMSRVH